MASHAINPLILKKLQKLGNVGRLQATTIVTNRLSDEEVVFFRRNFPQSKFTVYLKEQFTGQIPENFSISLLPDEAWLSVADASQTGFFCFGILNELRFDQIYMIYSEARRALVSGSPCIFSCASMGSSRFRKFLARLRGWGTNQKLLDVTHYFSPEDWLLDSNDYAYHGWSCVQVTQMTRL